jgi:hypothetical protein
MLRSIVRVHLAALPGSAKAQVRGGEHGYGAKPLPASVRPRTWDHRLFDPRLRIVGAALVWLPSESWSRPQSLVPMLIMPRGCDTSQVAVEVTEAGAATKWRVMKGVPQGGRIERWCRSWLVGVTVGSGSVAAEAVGADAALTGAAQRGYSSGPWCPRTGGDRLVAENRIPYTKASTRSRRTSALAPWLPSPPMHVQAAIDDVATAADRRPSLATSRCSSCQLRR